MEDILKKIEKDIMYFSSEIRGQNVSSYKNKLHNFYQYFDENIYWERENFDARTAILARIIRNNLLELDREDMHFRYAYQGKKILNDLRVNGTQLVFKLRTEN